MAKSRVKPHATRRGYPRKPPLRKGHNLAKPKKTARG